jgi:hypothetical protein
MFFGGRDHTTVMYACDPHRRAPRRGQFFADKVNGLISTRRAEIGGTGDGWDGNAASAGRPGRCRRWMSVHNRFTDVIDCRP